MFTSTPFKGCNCKKSKCLMKYCQCFAHQLTCGPTCCCKDCGNTQLNVSGRQFAFQKVLETNSDAFDCKFEPVLCCQVDSTNVEEVLFTLNRNSSPLAHKKGCRCKSSQCLKMYCECFNASMTCGKNCRCVDCRNLTERCQVDTLSNTLKASDRTSNKRKKEF